MKKPEQLDPSEPFKPEPLRAEGAEVDLSVYVDFVLGARWWIAIFVAAAVFLGGSYAFIKAPIYEADILIQVEESADSPQNLLGQLSSVFGIKTQAKTEMAILRSRMVVAHAVDALHLYIDARPRYFPLVGRFIAAHNPQPSNPGLFGLGGFAWGSEQIVVDNFDVPEVLYGERFDLELLGDGRYRLQSASEHRTFEGTVGRTERFAFGAGPVWLHVASVVGKPGARFVLTRESRLQTITNLETFMNVSETAVDSSVITASYRCTDRDRCRKTMHEIGTAYVNQNIQRKAEEAAKSLQFLDRQLPDVERQLERAEAKYTQFRDEHHTFDLPTEAQQLLAQSTDAQSKLADMRVQRELLASRFGPANPNIGALDSQMGALQRTIDELSRAVRRLPDVEQKAVGLMRDVQVNTQLYTELLSTAQQLKIVAAGSVGTVRLLDDAVTPEIPVAPKKLLILALSCAGGAVLGLLAAYIGGTLFKGIGDPHDIEARLGINVFATIPFSAAQDAMVRDAQRRGKPLTLLARSHPHESAVESLRSFRTALQFAMLGAPSNVLVVSGPTPGIGKSFVSVNSAEVLAASGKRILLVDADMRRGHLNTYCGVPRESGLSELIAGTKTAEEVTHRGIGSGFDLISCGATPPNPSELLLSDAFRRQVEDFSKRYDIVLIDTPPVLAVSDAEAVGLCAGVLFLVARYELTKLGEIQESVKRLATAGVAVKGVLFNGMTLASNRYRYGSRDGRYRYAEYGYYGPSDEGRR
jgi:tyrosine-protein kinase Etk/Wzc